MLHASDDDPMRLSVDVLLLHIAYHMRNHNIILITWLMFSMSQRVRCMDVTMHQCNNYI